jgi:MFS family permease
LLAVLVLVVAVRDVPGREDPGTALEPAAALRRLVPFLGITTLAAVGASVDLFTLARAAELGVPPSRLPLLWALLHVARASLARPLGALSDRLGRLRVIGCGLMAHIAVMLGFAAASDAVWLWPLFALHGLHAAFTEGAERGYVAALTGAGKRGRVFGVYHAVQGLAAFTGPLLLGAVWDAHGARWAFLGAAVATLLALLWLLAWARRAPS